MSLQKCGGILLFDQCGRIIYNKKDYWESRKDGTSNE